MATLRRLFQTVLRISRTFLRNLLYSLQNYLRSQMKETPAPMPRRAVDVIRSVLENSAFQDARTQLAKEGGLSPDQVESQSRTYLQGIAADTNYLYTPFWDFLIGWLVERVYEGVALDEKKISEFRDIAGKKPLVFVANHRSHMDYLLLSYIFYQHRIPLPHVCAGANLSFWPLGPLFRKGGAFFVRRSYNGNRLYARCVQAYIEQLIRDRSVLEFFIEGTRSRSGKLLPPRMGILSAIVQSYLNGAAEDILLVPTSLTYESVLEEQTYAQEQAGQVKIPEKPTDLVRLPKYLKRRTGKIYLQFGEPISLKQWLGTTDLQDKRRNVEELASQLTYGINKSTIVTPRSLVAMSLLAHPQRVIGAAQLPERIEPLLDYLRFKGCRLSEPLTHYRTASLLATVSNLADRGIIEPIRDEEGLFYLIKEEKRPLLDYYKNSSIHFFVSLAVVSAILLRPPETLSLNRLEEQFGAWQKLFRYEFTFSRRQPIRGHLSRILDYLRDKRVLELNDTLIRLRPGGREFLSNFQALIENFLEGYLLLWKSLPVMEGRRWEQRDLMRWLLDRGRISLLKDRIHRRESVSRLVFNNALMTFRDLGLLKQEREGRGKREQIFYRRIEGANSEILQSTLARL